MLLSVQAVGPKVALAVLSGGPAARAGRRRSPRATPRACRRFPGSASGPPSGSSSSCARRSASTSRAPARRTPIVARRGRPGDPRALARDGLLELGYAPEEAEELLADAEGESAEELIARALRLARADA